MPITAKTKSPHTHLVVAGISVRQKDALYCLNDLHKAAGGDNRYRPVYFLETDQAQGLIAELKSRNPDLLFEPVITTKGRSGGTYACKQIVYAYAMWISAAFQLNVIDAYDALVNGEIAKAKELASRTVLKDEYLPMSDALQRHRAEQGKSTKYFHFSNEADMINQIMTGMKSKQFKVAHSVDSVRDNLTAYGQKAMISLQRANTALIELGVDYQERKAKLGGLLETKWSAERLLVELRLVE